MLNKKGQSYISIIIGIIIIAMLSSLVYRSVIVANNQTQMNFKTFHSRVIAESMLDKEISKDVLVPGITEENQTVGNLNFTIKKEVTEIGVNFKNIKIEVIYTHKEETYSTVLSSDVEG